MTMTRQFNTKQKIKIIPYVTYEFYLDCDDIASCHISDTLPNLYSLFNKECNSSYKYE